MTIHELKAPQLGVNDDEVLVKWVVKSSTAVSLGQNLASLETTKAVVDLECDKAGFLYPLVPDGERVRIEEPLALVLDTPDEEAVKAWKASRPGASNAQSLPEGIHATHKAKALIAELGIAYDRLPTGRILRERDILALTSDTQKNATGATSDGSRKVVIWGAGNGGLTVLETLQAMGGIEVVGFVDRSAAPGKMLAGLPVTPENNLYSLRDEGVRACIVAISDRALRLRCLEKAHADGMHLLNGLFTDFRGRKRRQAFMFPEGGRSHLEGRTGGPVPPEHALKASLPAILSPYRKTRGQLLARHARTRIPLTWPSKTPRRVPRATKFREEPLNAIHPRAHLSPSVRLGGGNHVKAGAVIEAETVIGRGCIIDNGAMIPHHNYIADGVHIAPGVALGSSITIGARTLVGIGASVVTGVRVGADVIIGAGATVDGDIPERSIVQAARSKISPRGANSGR